MSKEKEEKTKTKEDEEIEKEDLHFANAEIVRIIRQNLPEDRMIRKRVKIGMNKFLYDIASNVTQKLAKKPFTYVEYDMFKEAIKPYKSLEHLNVEKNRLIRNLEKIKADCDVMIANIKRTFSIFEEEDEDEMF